MAAAMFFKHRKLMLVLPRQFGGKTELGVRLGHDMLLNTRGISAIFIAKSTSARRKATREKFIRVYEKEIFSVNTELVYHKKRPTNQLLMASVDKDPGANRGGTMGYIHWSEAAHSKIDHGESILDVWLKVFRPMLSQKDGYALIETTTNGKNGFKDMWDCAADFGFSRLLVPFSQMLEMGLVTQAEYDKEKGETLPLIFRQEYECEFITFQGRAYEEFDPEVHVAEVAPPAEWQRTAFAIDWGYDPSATCVLYGYIYEGVIHIYDEIYEKKQLIEETYNAMMARLQHWDVVKFAGVADHEQDRIDELVRRGIPCSKAVKSNTMGCRIQIKELLWKKAIKIHPRCKFLIRDLETATWHDKKEGDLDYGQCTYGHFDAEAALRYLVRELSGYEEEEPEINPHIGHDEGSAREWQLRRQTSDDFYE